MNRNLEEEAIFIRGLAQDVQADCDAQNVAVPLELCVYLVDLKLLQLSKSIECVATDGKLAKLVVERCVNDLTGDLPSVSTLKLQIFWREKYRTRDEIKKGHHETVFNNVLPMMTEIADGSLIKTVDKEELYRKIVVFIIMFAGLGSPTQQSIVKETQVALESIFKPTEMDNFLILAKSVKEQQLIEFARLITGIRLFNKDCKKGGEGIDDLPLILTQGVGATKERLHSFKDQLDKRVDHLAKALCRVYNLKEAGDSAVAGDEIFLSSEFEKGEVEDLKCLLVYYRQVDSCLKDLLEDLEESSLAVDELVERLQAILLQVHEVVRYRVAIATVQVFPLFLQLSNVWVEMQEEVDILSEINNNFADLNAVTKYKGFCAWTLAYTEGLLITGNISIGVLYFSDRFYSFSSPEAAYKWAKNPKLHIENVLNTARAKPELIRFLNMYADLDIIIEEQSAAQDEEERETENVAVQTELHPLESNISKEYTFSEWELKRRALHLATLTRCATKSQQTLKKSCFRTETGTQATPLKNRSTQTRRDNSCNHPIFPRFIWGLKTHWEEIPDSKLGGATKI